jgi:acetyl esterase/lipase
MPPPEPTGGRDEKALESRRILTSGTRDLFLSNTVRVHRKLRAAGVVADLIVFDGQSHAQYLFVPDAPEAKGYFTEVTASSIGILKNKTGRHCCAAASRGCSG